MSRKSKGDEPTEVKIKVTKDTKFLTGGSRDKKGTAVEADKLADTFKKDVFVRITTEGEGDKLTAKSVNTFTPGKKPKGKKKPESKPDTKSDTK